MSAQVETSVQAEGADDLKQFLNQHESSLKNSINAIYDVLKKAGLDKDDLLQFETIDLRKTLEDEGLKNLHIGRLINALKKIPESEIFKKSSTSKVVVLSSEEESALNNIKIKSKQFKQNAQIITNTLNELNTCYKNEQNMINTEFNKMLDAMNKRKNELLQKLTNMKNNKNDVLMKQLNSVKEYDAKLVQCYEESQKMIHSVSFDDAKRKTKILSITSQMLQDSKQFDDFTLGTTVKMHVQIDTNKIINTLKITGNITDAILEAPALTVKNVKSNSVRVNIKNKGDIIGHKLKYAEVNNDTDEVEWKHKDIASAESDIHYAITGLKRNTDYLIRAASTNGHGYGPNSDTLFVKTKDYWRKDIIGDYITIAADDKAVFGSYKDNWHSVYSDIVVQPGECYEWTLKINSFDATPHELNSQQYNHVWYILVGVCKDQDKLMRQERNTWPKNCLAYGGKRGILYSPRNEQYPNAKFVKPGDILKLKLDLKEMEVRLNINGVDYGVVPGVNLEKTNYRLWLSIYEKPLEMQMLSKL
eukprot:318631_1